MNIVKIKWIIIDLDNTILDFDTAASKALTVTFEQFEVPVTIESINAYKAINHECWTSFENGQIGVEMLKRQRFERLVDVLEISADPDRMNHLYLSTLGRQVDEMEGSRDFLEWSCKRFDLLLATNGFAQVQRPRIQRAGLQSYFKHIVISEEIGTQKPHKPFFDHTFKVMEHPHPDEIMIIGDSLSSDMAGGIAAGINTCWLNTNKQVTSGLVKPDMEVSNLHEVRKHFE